MIYKGSLVAKLCPQNAAKERSSLRKGVARQSSGACFRPEKTPQCQAQSWQFYREQRPECARLEGPSEAASWKTGTHKRVGEVHGDQTAESKNENRLGPKGQQFQLCKHQRSRGGFRCRSGDPAELSRRMGPPQSPPSMMMTLS